MKTVFLFCTRLKKGFAFVACLVMLLFSIQSVAADTAADEELKRQIDGKNEQIRKLEEEAAKYRNKIATKQQTGKTLKNELSKIQQTIGKLKNDIALTERRAQKTTLEVKQTALDIQAKEASIRSLQGGLANLLRIYSEKEKQSPLVALIKYKTLSDFFAEIDYSGIMQEKLLGSLDSLHTLREELKLKKAEAEEKKTELQKLQGTLVDRKQIQEVVKSARAELLAETKNQEKKYQQLLTDTQRKQEAILKEIEELESNLRNQIDPNSLPTRRKGLLLWPIYGRLSQGYGETSFVRGQHFYKFHNGIDISAPVGTPIMAADEGVVLATGNTDKYCPRGAYGRYVVINHNNNLATMYAHLSLIKVERGQQLKRGDLVGYTGNTGLSTGPHLHFTLYDAATVEIRLGTIGTCGLLPFGGSINPLDYL